MKKISLLISIAIILTLLIPTLAFADKIGQVEDVINNSVNSNSTGIQNSAAKIKEGILLEVGKDGLITGNIPNSRASEAWNEILGSYRIFVIGFFAIATISTVGMMIGAFISLGASAGNPKDRSRAIGRLLWTGIATTLLGGTLFFFTMFYNLF